MVRANLTAGNYAITAVLHSPVGWTMGSVNASIGKGELLTGTDIWLNTAEEEAVNEILNATVDPGGLTGTSSISGRVLAQTPFGNLMWFRINGGPLGGNHSLTKELLKELNVPIFAPAPMFTREVEKWRIRKTFVGTFKREWI